MSQPGKKSERKEPPEEAQLRTILDSMVEAVFVTDEKGRVTLTNRALDELVAEDVRGRRAKNVIRSEELRIAIRRARKLGEAAEVQLETEIGDRPHTFRAQVSPMPRGTGVVAVLHDVTGLKEADRVRRDFVANASHELRTPLTAIRGFAETLRDGALRDPEAARRFVDAILRHTLRLQLLADDLARLAQAESAEHGFEASPHDVRAICADAIASIAAAAREKRIRVRLSLPEGPVVARLSARALDHVLTNLLDNAIKYSPSETEVIVAARQSDDDVVIEVRDQGPGIPEKYQDRIFERFYRVDKGRSREEGGTGLGLAIAKHLVLRMGGDIEVESAPGKGSTFRVTVPLQATDTEIGLG